MEGKQGQLQSHSIQGTVCFVADAFPRTWPAEGADRGQRGQRGCLCPPLAAGAAARVVAQRRACAKQRLPRLKQLCRVLEQSAGQADLEVWAVHRPCNWTVAIGNQATFAALEGAALQQLCELAVAAWLMLLCTTSTALGGLTWTSRLCLYSARRSGFRACCKCRLWNIYITRAA